MHSARPTRAQRLDRSARSVHNRGNFNKFHRFPTPRNNSRDFNGLCKSPPHNSRFSNRLCSLRGEGAILVSESKRPVLKRIADGYVRALAGLSLSALRSSPSVLHARSLRLDPSVGLGNRNLQLLLIAVESPRTTSYKGNTMIHRHRVVGILASLVLLLGVAPAWAQTIDPEGMKGMEWRQIGPFRGGRVLAVTGVAGDANTFYMGTVAGGVWKTTNGGWTWSPLTDKTGIMSVGAIAVAPS